MLDQGLASLASALICMQLMRWTKGKHGIGWFIVCLLLIWP